MSAARIAVVGAGLAGLACARALQEAGHDVTVLERERIPGGRCASLPTPIGPCDHGLPELAAATPGFAAPLQAWAGAGMLAPSPSGPGRWLGVPSMQAFAARLAAGLKVVPGLEVAALERDGAQWWLRTHQAPPRGLELHYDAVAVAMPPEQALPLLGVAPALAEPLRAVRSEPCWSVVAAWPMPLPLRGDALAGNGAEDVLGSARRDARTRQGSRWVLHASAYWSANNLDVRPIDVVQRLLDAFGRAIGVRLARPSHAQAHLWRQARVAQPLAEPCGWDAGLRLGACGDAWCGTHGADGAERAWTSGRALAGHIAESLT